MSIYNTNQCEHGSLERQCEICERDNEIKELRSELAAAKGQVERLSVNRDWLLTRIDEIHGYLCPHSVGTWQQRAEQACQAARAALKPPSVVEAQSKGGWISVKERMPEEKSNVLLFNGEQRYQTTGKYMGDLAGEPVWSGQDCYEITHWRYLPEPPQTTDDSLSTKSDIIPPPSPLTVGVPTQAVGAPLPEKSGSGVSGGKG